YSVYGPRLKIARKGLTDDLGQFRLFGLPNFGEYVVSAGYSDRDRASAIGNIRLSLNVSKPDEGYAAVFHNSVSTITYAQTVRLAPGSDPAKWNLTFSDVPRIKVTGRVVPNVPGTSIRIALRGSNLADTNYVISPNPAGRFEIRGVSPGVYVLLATGT